MNLNVKLKPTVTIDKSAPKVNNLEEIKRNLNQVELTNIESYMEDLKHVLIPAYLFEITTEDAEALSNCYVHSKQIPSERDKKITEIIANKIDKLVEEKIGKGKKFFVR